METEPVHVAQLNSALQQVKRDRLIRLAECEIITGLRRSSLYGLIKAGKFVRPVRLSARCVAWSEAAVLTWVQDRIAEAGAKQ